MTSSWTWQNVSASCTARVGLHHLNHALDWVDKTDGLNMNAEWKLDINHRYT
jgi:hypothetical protein